MLEKPVSKSDREDAGQATESIAQLMSLAVAAEEATVQVRPQRNAGFLVQNGAFLPKTLSFLVVLQFEFYDCDELVCTTARLGQQAGGCDGHTKHQKKSEQTKAERRGKRSDKKASRSARAEAAVRSGR